MKLSFKILALFTSILVVSCTPQTNSGSSSSTSNPYDVMVEQATSWNECLSQNEEHYLVFFYSETCKPCSEIKGDVVSFANSNIVKTYFVDTAKPENQIQKCTADEVVVGIGDVSDLFIVGTPTLVEVKEGVTVSNVAGKSKCLNLINTLKNDSGN